MIEISRDVTAEIKNLRDRASSFKKRAMACLKMNSSLSVRQKRYEAAMRRSEELLLEAARLTMKNNRHARRMGREVSNESCNP